jgi:hypothetical protein
MRHQYGGGVILDVPSFAEPRHKRARPCKLRTARPDLSCPLPRHRRSNRSFPSHTAPQSATTASPRPLFKGAPDASCSPSAHKLHLLSLHTSKATCYRYLTSEGSRAALRRCLNILPVSVIYQTALRTHKPVVWPVQKFPGYGRPQRGRHPLTSI